MTDTPVTDEMVKAFQDEASSSLGILSVFERQRGAIAAALATQPEDPRIAELEAEAEESALQYLATAGQAQEALGEIAILKAQLEDSQAREAQMREALNFYASNWKTYCGDHGVPIGDEPTEKLLNDQGLRAKEALASTAPPAPQAIERIRQESRLEEREACAKVAENFAGSKHMIADMRDGIFPKQSPVHRAIASIIRSRSDGEG